MNVKVNNFARAGLTILLASLAPLAWAAADAALITALQGKVMRAGASAPLEAFVRLQTGDALALDKDTRLQITYFETGRQETGTGAGKLSIGSAESQANEGLVPAVKQVPMVIVKQLARTPAIDSQGRAGVIRLRAIATPEAIAKVDANYQQLRANADKSDLNPELYLLAGMFELRQMERVEQALTELTAARPADPEVKLLASLYRRAARDAAATVPAAPK